MVCLLYKQYCFHSKLGGNAFASVGSIQLDFNELRNLVEL